MKHLILLACLLLASCAGTEFYAADGKPVARFQGDMTRVDYSRAADGSIKWTADTVNHSAATTAGGVAVSKNILAAGTGIATSGLPALAK